MSADQQSGGTPVLERRYDRNGRNGRLLYAHAWVHPDPDPVGARRFMDLLWRRGVNPFRVDFEEFDTLADAQVSERRALRDEQPRFLTSEEVWRTLPSQYAGERRTAAIEQAACDAVGWAEERRAMR